MQNLVVNNHIIWEESEQFMKSNNTKTYIVKQEIANYSKKLSNTLSKPYGEFVLDIACDIAATSSSKISDISKALNENIELINTIDRLCSNLKSFNYKKQMWNIVLIS
jgi:hypothetical protein